MAFLLFFSYSRIWVSEDMKVIAGISRPRGEAIPRERKPASHILLELRPVFHQQYCYRATMHTTFRLVFAGFLKSGRFIWNEQDLLNEDLRHWHFISSLVDEDHLLLALPTKTDTFREDITIIVATAVDPVGHVSRGPLPYIPLTPKLMRDQSKHGLGQLSYAGIRRGAAKSAEIASLSREQFKQLSRWQSCNEYLDGDASPSRARNYFQLGILDPMGG